MKNFILKFFGQYGTLGIKLSGIYYINIIIFKVHVLEKLNLFQTFTRDIVYSRKKYFIRCV